MPRLSSVTFGMDTMVFAFIASSAASLDRLVAQSAVRPNTKRDVGNTVLDGHVGRAVAAGPFHDVGLQRAEARAYAFDAHRAHVIAANEAIPL